MHSELVTYDQNSGLGLSDGPSYQFPAGLPTVQLQICRGRAANTVRPVQVPVFLIGTAWDCDMVLGDPQFPEVHTYLFVNQGGVSVRHLGVGPELTVNGTPVHTAQLHDGDRLGLGSYELAVQVQAAAPPAHARYLRPTRIPITQRSEKSKQVQRRIAQMLNEIRTAGYPGAVSPRQYFESRTVNPPTKETIRQATA